MELPKNHQFSSGTWSEQIRAILREAVVQTSGTGWSLSDDDLSELELAKNSGIEQISTYFNNIIELSLKRRHNLSRFQNVDVLSLGFDCLGRTVPTRWGLKRPRCLGELSGPFDLAVHMPNTVSRLILQDFECYLDPKNLHFDKSLGYCVDRELKISFNHECGERFAVNNFEELIRVYQRRVEAFRKTLQTLAPLLFVAHLPPTMGVYKEQLESLKSLLSFISSRRSNKTAMLIIKTYNPGSEKPNAESFIDGQFCYHLVANPWDNYVWYEPHCFMCRAGFEWEESIALQIERVILSLMT